MLIKLAPTKDPPIVDVALPVTIVFAIKYDVVTLPGKDNPFALNVATILLANVPPTCIATALPTVSVPSVKLPLFTYK